MIANRAVEDIVARIVTLSPRLASSSNVSRWSYTSCCPEGSQSHAPCWPSGFRYPSRSSIASSIVDRWPGVFSDSERRLIGYWGLSVAAAYRSPHQLTIDGQGLSAWCAWDTLFLPELLGKPGEVESRSPGGDVVKLIVTPADVDHVEPTDAQVSFLMPDAAELQKDIVNTFCHFVHFFPSRPAGEAWAAQHPAGTFILSVAEAHEIARLKNRAQYGDVMASN